jgi:poly-gamma-glutamate capsule biosynthesis protein CapA/YwtB (metallophosphatase superfamily)
MRTLWFLFCSFLFVLPMRAQEVDTGALRFKMVFVGDVMGHDSQIASAKLVKDSLYDYSPCFEYISPILKQADLAIANLEVTLPGKPPYKGYPQFRSPNDLALALRYAGFNLLVTANNHSNDSGKAGVVNTINTLYDYGFYQTGTFQSQEERDAFYPLIVYRNQFKLAFLNYTYGTNGLPTRPPTIVNLIDEEQIRKDIIEAKALRPDFITVLIHWGLEYQLNENSQQRQLADSIFHWGADLVVGAHPHVVQPIKEVNIQQKDGRQKKGLIAYSLGNFISGQRRQYTDGGIMFEVEIEKKEVGSKAQIVRNNYIPVWRYIKKTGKTSTYQVVPIAPFEDGQEGLLGMSNSDKSKMKFYGQATRKQLDRFDSSERKITLQELGLFPKETIKVIDKR